MTIVRKLIILVKRVVTKLITDGLYLSSIHNSIIISLYLNPK